MKIVKALLLFAVMALVGCQSPEERAMNQMERQMRSQMNAMERMEKNMSEMERRMDRLAEKMQSGDDPIR